MATTSKANPNVAPTAAAAVLDGDDGLIGGAVGADMHIEVVARPAVEVDAPELVLSRTSVKGKP